MGSSNDRDSASPDSPVVFERLRVAAFRGFAEPVDIDLNASVVIVHGPNGLGKTSLFDALQWVLLGDLARLRDARMRRTDEYIVNAYRAGDSATVEVEIRLDNERVRLLRTGDRSQSVLTWQSAEAGTLRGQDAEDLLAMKFGGGPDLDLAASLNACGLLQQDATRDVLASKPRDRFEIFSKILGLGELANVEQWARGEAEQASSFFREAESQVVSAERDASQAAAALTSLQQIASTRPAVADVAARLHELIASAGFPNAVALETRDEAASVTAVATTVAREAADIASELRTLLDDAEIQVRPPADNKDSLARRRDQANEALANRQLALTQAQEELRRLQEAQASLALMASAVLPHVAGPLCPVCGQGVDESDLRLRLEELENGLSTTAAQQRVTETARAVEQSETAVISILRAEREAAVRDLRRAEWQRSLDRLTLRMTSMISPPALFGLSRIPADVSDAPPRLDALADAAAQVAALGRELTTVWDANTSAEETRAANRADQADERLQTARLRRHQLGSVRSRSSALHGAVRDARLEVVRQEFARLGPLAQDIYSRLDPHPTFQDIDLISETYRAAGTTVAQVRDPISNVTADPMVIFSSAQSNIAAISYLMALNLASVGAPVLLLDDPLQAMDDVNVLGFADLCRHVRRQRQLFVSTHERRFALLLERKLAPRQPSDRTIALEFVGWDRSGPTLKPRDVPDQSDQLSSAFTPLA